MSDIPEIMYWAGEKIDEMPRERLIEIISVLGKQQQEDSSRYLRNIRLLADVSKTRRGRSWV